MRDTGTWTTRKEEAYTIITSSIKVLDYSCCYAYVNIKLHTKALLQTDNV